MNNPSFPRSSVGMHTRLRILRIPTEDRGNEGNTPKVPLDMQAQ